MRKTEDKRPALVYAYKAFLDPLSVPAVEAELKRQDTLARVLIDLENAHRLEENALQSRLCPRLAEIEAQSDELTKLIELAYQRKIQINQQHRSRTGSGNAVADVAEWRAQWKKLMAEARALRATLWTKPAILALKEKYKSETPPSRAPSGPWWGNYNAVVKRVETSIASQRKALGTRIKEEIGRQLFAGQPMDIPRARREASRLRYLPPAASLTIQIRKSPLRADRTRENGMTAADLLSGGVSPFGVVVDTTPNAKMGDTRRGRRTYAVLDVCAGKEARARFRVIFHRPLPPDCAIKSVEIVRQPLGGAWKACFSIRTTHSTLPPDHPKEAVRLRFCPRIIDGETADGIKQRGLAVMQSETATASWALFPEIFKPLPRLEELQKRRDAAVKEMASAVLGVLALRGAPKALREFLPALQEARGMRRAAVLDRLERAWRAEPWEPAVYTRLQNWRSDDRRDWREYTNLWAYIKRRRDDLCRKWAANLCQKFSTIYLPLTEKLQLWEIKDAPTREVERLGHRYRALAAPGRVRDIICNAAARRGVAVLDARAEEAA